MLIYAGKISLFCHACETNADCKIIGTGTTVFNGFLCQITTRKSLKTVEKVSIILQLAAMRAYACAQVCSYKFASFMRAE